MGVIRTYLAAKAEAVKAEAEWQSDMQQVVRPEQIKLKAAQQLNAVHEALAADPKVAAIFKTLKFRQRQT